MLANDLKFECVGRLSRSGLTSECLNEDPLDWAKHRRIGALL